MCPGEINCLFSGQHFCQKLSQSNCVGLCKDYSKSKVGRFLRHSVYSPCSIVQRCCVILRLVVLVEFRYVTDGHATATACIALA